MNERIKLLALQAGEYVNSAYTPPIRSKEPGKIWEDGHVDWMEQFNEKFAELLLRNLAEELADVAQRSKKVNPEWANGVSHAAMLAQRMTMNLPQWPEAE